MGLRFERSCLVVSCLASWLAASACRAGDGLELPSFLHLSGFGTLGMATSDSHDHALLRDQQGGEGISASTSPLWADSRLGLQMDAEITPELTATIQGVFQKDPPPSFTNTVQWAFLKYEPVSWLQLRAGRMGTDSFMLSDLRNVGFTYLMARPPIEFYGLFPVYSYDGGNATVRTSLTDDWSLELEGLYGASRFTMSTPGQATADLKFPVFWGGNAVLRDANWTFRVSGLRAHIGDSFPGIEEIQSGLQGIAPVEPQALPLAAQLRLQGGVHFYSAGLGYEDGDWTGMAEYARTACECALIHDNNAAYALLGHHFGEWTPFLSYSRVWQDHPLTRFSTPLPVPQIQALFAAGNAVSQAVDLDQDDRTVGVRWNFSDKADLKLQYDNYHVHNFSVVWRGLDNAPPGGSGTVNVFSAAIDFIF